MDDYLRGVVPLEIGTTSPGDAAAVEAQAVTARSYAVTRLGDSRRAYDMTATTQDQVYGGADAETAVGNASVDATQGLVLLYSGAVVNAPYHANCGGYTAAPQDSWRAAAEPYLQRVSDQIPGTNRYYCDQAPRFRWTRVIRRRRAARARSGATCESARRGGRRRRGDERRGDAVTPGGPRRHAHRGHGSRALVAARQRDPLRRCARLVASCCTAPIFPSTSSRARTAWRQFMLRGGGNGHGVGMCQSGAIGRARAGQDFRTILRTYYPGTTVGTIQ